MGDRTTVTLTVLKNHLEEAKKYFEYEEAEEETVGEMFANLLFYEVNYGTLHFLGKLMEAGIPFTSDWDSGGDYGPGSHFCRYTADGELQEIELSNDYRNPELSRLMELLDEPVALKEYIINHHKAVTPLPWDNQLEYSKVFRIKKLING